MEITPINETQRGATHGPTHSEDNHVVHCALTEPEGQVVSEALQHVINNPKLLSNPEWLPLAKGMREGIDKIIA